MTDQQERRKIIRRQIESVFESAPDDRRRMNYERRNRTTVLPIPLEMAVLGERRRYPESGME